MEQSDKRKKHTQREREVWVNKLIKRRLKKMNILIDRLKKGRIEYLAR